MLFYCTGSDFLPMSIEILSKLTTKVQLFIKKHDNSAYKKYTLYVILYSNFWNGTDSKSYRVIFILKTKKSNYVAIVIIIVTIFEQS